MQVVMLRKAPLGNVECALRKEKKTKTNRGDYIFVAFIAVFRAVRDSHLDRINHYCLIANCLPHN